ncbi:nucleotide exchange factor GrpE [Formosa sediminum]|uniref:Protein GrpE n=2 Tax=Formosa sediminum TaxID=2594004 RepID=A0A516GVX2_9FLAO|nr:nucleotide exchange factor GrpE [Formosa sediminum]QDO95678.1 nucleotide exchange factor GrpE [Formosa sediminum]
MSKEELKKDVEVENIEEQVEQQVEEQSEEQAAESQEVSVEEELQTKLKEEKDKFLRLFAEFENYKKRTSKERIELFKTANQDVMVAMLPILDDFDRAYSEISKTKEKNLLKGVELISNKLKNVLQSKGLELVEVAAGDTFNADHHEAITQIPSPTPDMKGKIIDVIEKGYKLGEKVIRFPKVVIGQ